MCQLLDSLECKERVEDVGNAKLCVHSTIWSTVRPSAAVTAKVAVVTGLMIMQRSMRRIPSNGAVLWKHVSGPKPGTRAVRSAADYTTTPIGGQGMKAKGQAGERKHRVKNEPLGRGVSMCEINLVVKIWLPTSANVSQTSAWPDGHASHH